MIRLPPDFLGLRLHSGDAAEDHDRAIQHAQRTLHLDRKIHVAGRVNQVNRSIFPLAGRDGGRDSNAALLLLWHPIHRRRAIVHFADFMRHARIIEQAFGDGGFPSVNMRDNPDIPYVVYACLHRRASFRMNQP